MKDRTLERQIRSLKDFIALWVKFQEICRGIERSEGISQREEDLFLQVKSEIARNYQAIMDIINIKPVGDRTLAVISRAPSLESIRKMGGDEKEVFEGDWHGSYIELNRLLGGLEAKKQQLQGINRLNALFRITLWGFMLKLVILIAIAAGVYYVITVYHLGPLIKDGLEAAVEWIRDRIPPRTI